MNKIVWIIAAISIIGIVVAAAGWQLMTAENQINIVEGVSMQYLSGDSWVDMPVNQANVELPLQVLMPGETNTLYIKASNTAETGTLGLVLNVESVDWLSHSVVCGAESTGTQYTKVGDEVFIKLPSNQSVNLGISTTADGNTPVGGINFSTTVTRTNPLEAYLETC
jgi:hypothetical protein